MCQDAYCNSRLVVQLVSNSDQSCPVRQGHMFPQFLDARETLSSKVIMLSLHLAS